MAREIRRLCRDSATIVALRSALDEANLRIRTSEGTIRRLQACIAGFAAADSAAQIDAGAALPAPYGAGR